LKRIIARKKFNQEKAASRSYTDLTSLNKDNSSTRKSTNDLTTLSSGKPPLAPPASKKGSPDTYSIQMVSYSKEEVQPLQSSSKGIKLTKACAGWTGMSVGSTAASEDVNKKPGLAEKPSYSSLLDIQGDLPTDDVEFFEAIDEEVKKINKFYIGKIAELQV
jgi:hypothetical protein